MSNTSEALRNVRILRARRAAGEVDGKLRTWLVKAADCLPCDIVLAPHIDVRVELCLAVPSGAVVMQCERCGQSVEVESVAAAADFRDRHWHCGGTHCEVWRCTTCDYWAFEFEERCRFCDAPRDPDGPRAVVLIETMLNQYASYDVFLPGRKWRATILCNSLLRAKRAARAMYRWREAEVRFAGKGWNAEVRE